MIAPSRQAPLGPPDIVALSLAYDELYLPWKLDLIQFDRVEEPALREHVERVGKVLFEKK